MQILTNEMLFDLSRRVFSKYRIFIIFNNTNDQSCISANINIVKQVIYFGTEVVFFCQVV
jgi:hypothetical protein